MESADIQYMPNPSVKIGVLLEESLRAKRLKNPAYSARALARDIGVSAAYLSMIRTGKKSLSLEKAMLISSRLGLKGSKKTRFLKAAGISSLGKIASPEELSRIFFEPPSSEDFETVQAEQFEFFNRWYHVAVLDLVTCRGFKSDVAWIAKRLGITEALAAAAVERLLSLGLLVNEKGTLKKTNAELSVPTTRSVRAVRNFHTQMIEKALHALKSDREDDFQRRDITGLTMSVDPSKMAEAKERIALFKREMYELMATGENNTDVFQLNIQLFPLTGKDE